MGNVQEAKAKRTLPKLKRAQRELGMPAWDDLPVCESDLANRECFFYMTRTVGDDHVL